MFTQGNSRARLSRQSSRTIVKVFCQGFDCKSFGVPLKNHYSDRSGFSTGLLLCRCLRVNCLEELSLNPRLDMKTSKRSRFIALIIFCFSLTLISSAVTHAQNLSATYAKQEVRIPMRDGKTLHTAIFSPRDQSQKYPIMIIRTPYSCRPYGANAYPQKIGPSRVMEQDGYIFVKQDVRGRWNSEGNYDNMRPNVPGNEKDLPVDESSDTYDTIDWLLANVANHNGNVGMWGISYPGFYTAAALPDHHPALVAASPQAPISDFFFDDFHHHGAYLLSYLIATNTFGFQHPAPTTNKWYPEVQRLSEDAWSFYMNLGGLSNADPLMGQKNEFWQQLTEHPNYDEFWQKRSILPHLKNVTANVMTVGGWFDAEDLYGPLNIYKSLEKNNPGTFNTLVMGPFDHGGWSRDYAPIQVVGNVAFGPRVAEFYQKRIELPYFQYFLKGIGSAPQYEAMVFDTGKKTWSAFTKWPPTKSVEGKVYLRGNRTLSNSIPDESAKEYSEFVSDPMNPVPYRKREDIKLQFTPRYYMTDDQRFATQRGNQQGDVLVFQTGVLQDDYTLVGELLAHLQVSTSETDADWIVKLIDVYPDNHPWVEGTPPGIVIGGYQQMVRSEVMRGRFRNSYSKPEPFVPNEVTTVDLPLQDIFHTFKKGHRIMVHIQSTWFPLIDRNPQKYVENIFEAKNSDFTRATHRLYHSQQHPSWLEYRSLPKN